MKIGLVSYMPDFCRPGHPLAIFCSVRKVLTRDVICDVIALILKEGKVKYHMSAMFSFFAGEKDLTITSFYVVILSSCEFTRAFVR